MLHKNVQKCEGVPTNLKYLNHKEQQFSKPFPSTPLFSPLSSTNFTSSILEYFEPYAPSLIRLFYHFPCNYSKGTKFLTVAEPTYHRPQNLARQKVN